MKWNELSIHNNLMGRNALDMKRNIILLNALIIINNFKHMNELFY